MERNREEIQRFNDFGLSFAFVIVSIIARVNNSLLAKMLSKTAKNVFDFNKRRFH